MSFEEASKKAAERGMRVTGSELVGLVPLEACWPPVGSTSKNRKDRSESLSGKSSRLPLNRWD
jgi:hypothetical protein